MSRRRNHPKHIIKGLSYAQDADVMLSSVRVKYGGFKLHSGAGLLLTEAA